MDYQLHHNDAVRACREEEPDCEGDSEVMLTAVNKHDEGTDRTNPEKASATDAAPGSCRESRNRLKSCTTRNIMKWYLLVFSLSAFMVNLLPFGLTFAVFTTLEKRFHMSSTESGIILSVNYLTIVLVTPFVGYLGENGHKPVWIGVGSMVLAIGSIIFALPHFLSDPYYMETLNQSDAVCSNMDTPLIVFTSGQGEKCGTDDGNSERYLWLFILGHLLFGYAHAPIVTLGLSYLEENVVPASLALYFGIYAASQRIGSALGFFVGAQTLSMYADILVDVNRLSVTPDSPLWIGAWWLGFILGAIVAGALAVVMMRFPKTPAGNCKHLKETTERRDTIGCRYRVFNFAKALRRIGTNLPFMCLCFGIGMEWFVATGLEVYVPKYFETQLNMGSSEAAYIIGVITVSSTLIGPLVGGEVMKRLNLKLEGMVKLCLLTASLGTLSVLMFTMYCHPVPFAGVTTTGSWSSRSNQSQQLTLPCNSHCDCSSKAFEPICGSNDVMYYSPCHAGCRDRSVFDSKEFYYSCRCVLNQSAVLGLHGTTQSNNISNYHHSSSTPLYDEIQSDLLEGRAISGRCPTSCLLKWPLFIFTWIFLFLFTFTLVPSWTASMRCVSHSERAFALAVQQVIMCVACTLTPLVFGPLIDKTCWLWETFCTGSKTCWMYDNRLFANSFLGLALSGKLLSLVFFGATYFVHRPEIVDKESVP